MTTANNQRSGSESCNTMSSFSRNALGTVDFLAKWGRMREAQTFMVYPVKAGEGAERLTIQSKTRIGTIDTVTGWVTLSPPCPRGACFLDLHKAAPVHRLDAEEMLMLKAHVFGSASASNGAAGVIVDNAGAREVFAQAGKPLFLG